MTSTRRGLARCVLVGILATGTSVAALATPAAAATSAPGAATPEAATTPAPPAPTASSEPEPAPAAPSSSTAPAPSAPAPAPSPSSAPATPSARPTPSGTPRSTPSASPGSTPSTTPSGTPSGTPSPSPSTSRTPVPAPLPEPGVEEALSPEQVRQQVAAAAELRAQLGRTDARLAAAVSTLSALSAKVSAALQAQRAADQAASAATLTAATQLARLATLRRQVLAGEDELGQWARTAYTSGGPLAAYEGWVTAMQGTSTNEVAHDLALLGHVGVLSSATLDRLQDATLSQRSVTASAVRAAVAAKTAQTKAAAAKAAVNALLTKQRQELATLQASELMTANQAAAAGVGLARSSSAAAMAEAAQLEAVLAARSSGRPIPLDPDDCQGLDLSAYGNGEIPSSALCPLWGSPGDMLRADAAAAFGRMSKAYAAQFGRPICVTDSYRSRGEQVVVYAQKPHLAARPGTSNHGWGTAIDLCGGVQSFATIEHLWMQTHAGLYGWFHPSWAGANGSKPEPWHWEFAG